MKIVKSYDVCIIYNGNMTQNGMESPSVANDLNVLATVRFKNWFFFNKRSCMLT